MNDKIIKNFNKCMSPEDTLIHIGDYCFNGNASNNKGNGIGVKAIDYENRIHAKLILIKGNHDKSSNTTKAIIHNMVIQLGGFEIFLTHKPQNYNPNYLINLVGHRHTDMTHEIKDDCILINVGVDVWNFKPITIEDIYKKYGKIIFELKKKRGIK